MSIVSQIKHYQQSIEKCSNNESRLLHCIEKLYKLPVTVQHLQDTGVGRTVNALRKYEGTVGDASKALVAKWKTMVVDEESSDAEDDDDQNLPDVPEPYSDNSDLGIDKPKSSSPEKTDKHLERNSTRRHDSKHNRHHHSNSESSFKENSRSRSDKKSSKSSHDSREKKDRNDRDKSKSTKDKEKEKSSSRSEISHESQKVHRSDSIKRETKKESSVYPSKENKQLNGSDQNRKRKRESSNGDRNPEKRANNSTDETSDTDGEILPSSSVKYESSKTQASRKDSKREEKDVEKSRLNCEKSDGKHKSTRDPASSSSSSSSSSSPSSSRKKPSKSKDEVQKSSDSSPSKSKHGKPKSPEKKKIKKHFNGDEGIDCNSGATFAEALGMCSAPQVRKKSAPVSPSSPVMKPPVKAESNASSLKEKLAKTRTLPKDDALSLLGPNAKLEPLSIDLASTLPEISTNYKPLPVNNYLSSMHRKMEEDKVLNEAIYVKNMRTKVFSGNKSVYTSVPSLYDLCIRVLIDNIDALEATGGVPYDILKPVLERATPDQLFMLEHHNPYLIEDTDSLWQFHCNREFRNKQREEMETFREMYMRCLDEREAKLKTLTANIKQSIDKSVPVRSAKLAFVDNFVKPPRHVLRKQAKYGTARSSTSTSDIKKSIITGSHAATNISVPPPPMSRVRTGSGIVKKNKAPLMAKALQLIKGRYKR